MSYRFPSSTVTRYQGTFAVTSCVPTTRWNVNATRFSMPSLRFVLSSTCVYAKFVADTVKFTDVTPPEVSFVRPVSSHAVWSISTFTGTFWVSGTWNGSTLVRSNPSVAFRSRNSMNRLRLWAKTVYTG